MKIAKGGSGATAKPKAKGKAKGLLPVEESVPTLAGGAEGVAGA